MDRDAVKDDFESRKALLLRDLGIIFELQKGVRRRIYFFLGKTCTKELSLFLKAHGFIDTAGLVDNDVRHAILCRNIKGFNDPI